MINRRHYYENPDEYLECQACGDPIKHLTPEQRDHMFYNPYDWVAYCQECIKLGAHLVDLI